MNTADPLNLEINQVNAILYVYVMYVCKWINFLIQQNELTDVYFNNLFL